MREPIKQFNKHLKDTLNITLFIVDKCNYGCYYCYNDMPRHLVEADLDIMLKFIEDIRSKHKTRPIFISILGGEPTLHPKLLDFVRKLTSLGDIKIEVVTNLSGSVELYGELLKCGVFISASWHGTKTDGINHTFINNLGKLPEEYFQLGRIEIRVLLEPRNWDNSRKVLDELLGKYGEMVEICMVVKKDGTPFEYSEQQLEEYNQYIIKNDDNFYHYTLVYSDGTTEDITTPSMVLSSHINFHLWRCNAGIDSLYVHVNGDVYVCQSYYEFKLGRLYNINDYNGAYLEEKMKPCICKSKYCSCNFYIEKEKILGIKNNAKPNR